MVPSNRSAGKLVTERFAAASRHDDQHICAGRDRCNYFFLRIEELSETEIFFKNFMGGHRMLTLPNGDDRSNYETSAL